jgi:hypothetical protein
MLRVCVLVLKLVLLPLVVTAILIRRTLQVMFLVPLILRGVTNLISNMIAICWRDLKTGADSEIRHFVITCWQLVKTASIAMVYAILFLLHLIKWAVEYLAQSSVHLVKTQACVVADSDFCSHRHH